MKKILFFLFAIILSCLLFGCSLFEKRLSPPGWIIGTWSDEFYTNTWTFTSDNAVFDSPMMKIDFSLMQSSHTGVRITDETASSYLGYFITMKDSSGTACFKFIQDYANIEYLDYYITTSGLTTGPLTLIKQ